MWPCHGAVKGNDAARGWGPAAILMRLRGIRRLYREIHSDLRPTYCALVFATLANQSQRVIVQSMLPLYAAYYMQLSPTQTGMLFTISGVIVFVMIVPAGFLMDRVGRKWCTVPSTGIPALRVSANSRNRRVSFTSRFLPASPVWRKVYRWALWPLQRTTSCRRTHALACRPCAAPSPNWAAAPLL